MTFKTASRKNLTLAALFLAIIGLAAASELFVADVDAAYPRGSWEASPAAIARNSDCPLSKPCVEWCIRDEQENLVPTDTFCCMYPSQLPSSRFSTCTDFRS